MTAQPYTWLVPDRALADSPAGAYLASIGPGSRRTVQQSLAHLAASITGAPVDPIKFRWEALRRPETLRLRAELKDAFAPATANKILSVLRGVLRCARNMGLMNEPDFQTAASLEQVKAARASKARPVSISLVASLLAACDTAHNAASARDAALLAIFLCSGLRRAEAAALDAGDYNPAAAILHIRGERPEYDRVVHLAPIGKRLLAAWLAIRGTQSGPLLTPISRGGLIQFRRMTDQAIYDIFGRIAERANTGDITTRDLRAAYVMGLIRAGKSVEEVRYLVGHASWLTPATYRRMSEDTSAPSYCIDDLPA